MKKGLFSSVTEDFGFPSIGEGFGLPYTVVLFSSMTFFGSVWKTLQGQETANPTTTMTTIPTMATKALLW